MSKFWRIVNSFVLEMYSITMPDRIRMTLCQPQASWTSRFFSETDSRNTIGWEYQGELIDKLIFHGHPLIFTLDRMTLFKVSLAELYITILTFLSDLQSPGSVEWSEPVVLPPYRYFWWKSSFRFVSSCWWLYRSRLRKAPHQMGSP